MSLVGFLCTYKYSYAHFCVRTVLCRLEPKRFFSLTFLHSSTY